MVEPANITIPMSVVRETVSYLPEQHFSEPRKGLDDPNFQGILASLQTNPFAPARSNNITLGGFHGIELKDSPASVSDISEFVKSAISKLVSAAANGVNLHSTDLKFGETGKLSIKLLPGQKHLELQIHSGKNIASTLMNPEFLKFLDASGLKSVTIKVGTSSQEAGQTTVEIGTSNSETHPLVFARIDAGAEGKYLRTTSVQQNKIAELLKEKGLDSRQFTLKQNALSKKQHHLRIQNQDQSQLRHFMNINTKIDKMVGSILEKAVSDPVAKNHLNSIRSSLREVAGQLKMSVSTGNASEITVQAKDANVAEWLRKQIQPVLKQVHHYLESQGVKSARVVKKSGSHGFAQQEESSGGMFSSLQNRSILQSKKKGDQFHSGLGEKEMQNIVVQTQKNLQSSLALQASKFTGTPQMNSAQMLETIQKIADMVQSQSALTGHRIGIQMNVQDLGNVAVDALKQAHKINLQIQVDTQEAKRLVEAHLKPFAEQMIQRGIEIGKLDVSVRDNRSENQNQQPQSQNPLNWQGFSENRHGQESAQAMQDMLMSQLIHRNTGSQTVEIWA